MRRACFTSFQDIPGNWPQRTEWPDTVTYAVWQIEKAPGTGRLHVQGYVEFSKALGMQAIKDAIGDNTAHIEEAKGTSTENKKYCSKSDSRIDGPFEFGKQREQGKRSDLAAVYEDVKAGKTLVEVMDNNPVAYIKFSRGIKDARFLIQQKAAFKRRDVVVTVIWGQTGTGKTRSVLDEHGDENVFILNKQSSGSQIWWDGYDGQNVLLIDEFYGWIPYDSLLRLLDIYNTSLPVKGSFTHAGWTRVYITSNKHPRDWYKNVAEKEGRIGEIPAALERRMHKIAELKTIGSERRFYVEKELIPTFYSNSSSQPSSTATTPRRSQSPIPHLRSQDSTQSVASAPSQSQQLLPWINQVDLQDDEIQCSPMYEPDYL